MFRPQVRQSQLLSCARKPDQWRIAFAHRDHVLAVDGGQQFAEAPHAADIFRQRSRSALFPYFAQAKAKFTRCTRKMWINNLQQLMALRAAEHSIGRGLHHAALNAFQKMSCARDTWLQRDLPALFSSLFIALPLPPACVGRRHSGMFSTGLAKNSSCTDRTTSAAPAAVDRKTYAQLACALRHGNHADFATCNR